MRLFRDEEAARKAGVFGAHVPFMVLTPRERALLGALEAVVAAGAITAEQGVALAAAVDLINSMNVEG